MRNERSYNSSLGPTRVGAIQTPVRARPKPARVNRLGPVRRARLIAAYRMYSASGNARAQVCPRFLFGESGRTCALPGMASYDSLRLLRLALWGNGLCRGRGLCTASFRSVCAL